MARPIGQFRKNTIRCYNLLRSLPENVGNGDLVSRLEVSDRQVGKYIKNLSDLGLIRASISKQLVEGVWRSKRTIKILNQNLDLDAETMIQLENFHKAPSKQQDPEPPKEDPELAKTENVLAEMDRVFAKRVAIDNGNSLIHVPRERISLTLNPIPRYD